MKILKQEENHIIIQLNSGAEITIDTSVHNEAGHELISIDSFPLVTEEVGYGDSDINIDLQNGSVNDVTYPNREDRGDETEVSDIIHLKKQMEVVVNVLSGKKII